MYPTTIGKDISQKKVCYKHNESLDDENIPPEGLETLYLLLFSLARVHPFNSLKITGFVT
jgi:hypothetical protein